MPFLTHLSIKVADLEKATAFYEEVLGFKYIKTRKPDGHISRHLSDGKMDLTLMQYESEDSQGAQLAGAGPRIHHYGIEVDEPMDYHDKLKSFGCEIIEESPTISETKFLRFRAPDGSIGELVETGTFKDSRFLDK